MTRPADAATRAGVASGARRARIRRPGRRGSRRGRPPIEDVAVVSQRLAVLLSAGVPPSAAWRHLERAGQSPSTVAIVAAAADAAADGGDIAGAIARRARSDGRDAVATRRAWEALAAVWCVAVDVGAPLAGCLRTMAASFRADGRLQREAAVALAGPRATARLVAFLPIVAVVFGAALGFDTVGILLTTPAGWVCTASGSVLLLAGARWSAALVRRASRARTVPGLALELVAIALTGGVSLERARATADRAIGRYGGPIDGVERVAEAADRGARTDAVLALARSAGIPAAELLLAEADDLRLEAQTAGQERAARLGVHLMIPLAVCILPAFMLLGVAPMLLAVLSSTAATL